MALKKSSTAATEPTMRSAVRLAEAKRDVARFERELAALAVQRKEHLLAGDDAGRRRCDHRLTELRLDLQAARDAVAWLPELAALEHQKANAWPTSLESAQAKLLVVENRLAGLQRIPKLDRSAVTDGEIDDCVQKAYALEKLIARLTPHQETAA